MPTSEPHHTDPISEPIVFDLTKMHGNIHDRLRQTPALLFWEGYEAAIADVRASIHGDTVQAALLDLIKELQPLLHPLRKGA